MRSKLFHCVWPLVAAAAALGCGATTKDPAPPRTATYAKSSDATATSTKKTMASPMNRAMHPNPPADPHASHGPISLTGEKPYGERFDASGWSGSSTPPEGVGGGPTENAENPYEDEAPPMTPTPSAIDPNDQKDLDTAPAAPPADDQPPPQ